jgi:hypothetical protein
MTEFETRLLRMMEVLLMRRGCDLPDPPVSQEQTRALLVPNYWRFEDGKILIGVESKRRGRDDPRGLPAFSRVGGWAPGTRLMPRPRVEVTYTPARHLVNFKAYNHVGELIRETRVSEDDVRRLLAEAAPGAETGPDDHAMLVAGRTDLPPLLPEPAAV